MGEASRLAVEDRQPMVARSNCWLLEATIGCNSTHFKRVESGSRQHTRSPFCVVQNAWVPIDGDLRHSLIKERLEAFSTRSRPAYRARKEKHA